MQNNYFEFILEMIKNKEYYLYLTRLGLNYLNQDLYINIDFTQIF